MRCGTRTKDRGVLSLEFKCVTWFFSLSVYITFKKYPHGGGGSFGALSFHKEIEGHVIFFCEKDIVKVKIINCGSTPSPLNIIFNSMEDKKWVLIEKR